VIQDKNVDNTAAKNNFAQTALNFFLSVGAGVAGVIQGGWRAPWAGKIVSVIVYAATLTDADDSVRIDVQKNGVTVLSATVDPGAADTATVATLSATASVLAFAAGDKIQVVATTGAGDAMVGTVSVMVRPRLGRELMPGFTTS
jgi:sugar/nucleoside kinase (ribokinase family)